MKIISPIPKDSGWQIRRLLFWNGVWMLLLLSLFFPGTNLLWERIDTGFFYLVNQPLEQSHWLRIFWAAANHRLADWFEDLCIFAFFAAAFLKTARVGRQKRSAQFVFCVLLIATTILLVNRLVCRDFLRLRRDSPTHIFDDAIILGDYLSSFLVKTDSTKSFPGDHATTALLFAFSYAYFVRGKLGIAAIAYGLFLCLPRLVVGAHWLSDIVVGSGSIVIFSLSWALFTPLSEKATQLIVKRLPKKKAPVQS